MNIQNDFSITSYEFDKTVPEAVMAAPYAGDLWPVVYVLSKEGKKRRAYVGETTDAGSRMQAHLNHLDKRHLTRMHLISGGQFNKSVALDIESNLIKYLAADGKYHLLNSNLGIANHRYYQQREYRGLFSNVWNKLRSLGLAERSLEYIENLNLFKYSPYKSLSTEQTAGLIAILESLAGGKTENTVVQGGAGTGKSILAIFLFKLLQTSLEDFNTREFGAQEQRILDLVLKIKADRPDLSMALVVPMSSFRKTLQNVFRDVDGLNRNSVIGPSSLADKKYDLVVVDEAHRLRQRVNLGAAFGSFDRTSERLGLDKNRHTELDWVLQQSERAVLFYDADQSIKPSDVPRERFGQIMESDTTSVQRLYSQFRVKGGRDYVEFLDKLLNRDLEPGLDQPFNSPHYEVKLFESLGDMVEAVRQRNDEVGLSRLIAGFAWPWVSKPSKKGKSGWQPFDIVEDGVQLRWNTVAQDWINAANCEEEVGCIHTTQGYDLNYAGVIIGHEFAIDPATGQLVANKDAYHDRNGKATIRDPQRLLDYVRNIYKTILLRGIRGTYLYVVDPLLRAYIAHFVEMVPRKSVAAAIVALPTIHQERSPNSVPLYALTAAAGQFSDVQDFEMAEEWISLPPDVSTSPDLFAMQVRGESMNKIIPSGSICLFRRYSGGSRNGKIVLCELNDFRDPDNGTSLTVKEYLSEKAVLGGDDRTMHRRISLMPRSTSPDYKAIEVTPEMAEGMQVIAEFVRVLTS